MASNPEEGFAADDPIVISPDGHGPDTEVLGGDEITHANEEWPVAEFYRIEPDEDHGSASHESRHTIIATQSAPATAGLRRSPPPLGSGLLLVAAGAIGAILLAAIALNLLRDGDEDATAAAPVTTSSSSSPVTSPSTSTSALGGANALMDLEGMSLRQARLLLERAGLRMRVRRLESDRPRGEVLNQSPAANADVQKNRLIVLVVSSGASAPIAPESASVPEVLGLAGSDAVAALRNADFDVRIRLVASSETAGTVVRQSPAGETQASRGSEIVLDIAKSRPVPQRFELPDVAGLTASAARRALRDAGFTVTVISVQSDEPVGTVVTQSPHAGAQLRKSAAVTLRVSSGPAEVGVPDVTGLDEESARFELESAGFGVRVIDEPTTDAEKDGVVVGQSPPGGAAWDEGGVVTITVGQLD